MKILIALIICSVAFAGALYPRSGRDLMAVSAANLDSQVSESSELRDGDRFFVRVSACDDGGRAYVNGTKIVDVGFGENSDWLDVTQDLVKAKNKIKFEVINKTGAITYLIQVRKNNSIVYEQACGQVAVLGCESNRAFRVGVAREFTYSIVRTK
jgi:hypothetical protein